MKIKYIEITKLNPALYNPRNINDKQIKGLTNSIKKYGFVEPIVINKDYTVISGHQRLKVANKLSITTIPCYIVNLNKKEEKKLNILLNSHAISGSFDDLKLIEILEEFKLDNDYLDLNLDDLDIPDIDFENIKSTKNREKTFKTQNIICPNCQHTFIIQI